jgi:hypothetical protein
MSYPKGNAQVCDTVWYRCKNGKWRRDWKVVEVGLMNEHEYPLNIRIGRGRARRIVSPFDSEHVCILPVVLDPVLAKSLRRYPNLVAVRHPRNGDTEAFDLLCAVCDEVLDLRCREDTVRAVTLERGADGEALLFPHKEELVDAHECLSCGCQDRGYDFPLAEVF